MLHTLNVAQTGLKASQTQVENVMNNIANENVDGYKKRVVDVSELGHADGRITGRGIFVNGVSRTTQVYLYQNLIIEQSKLSEMKELNSTLANIESIFKETDTAGLSVEINNYFKSIEHLRTTPHSEIYKNDTINSAKSVILELQKIYEAIEQKENSMLNNTEEVVSKVNSILKEIGSISAKIENNTYGNPNDLLDKRDALEKELAEYIDVEISRDEQYELKVAGVTAVRFSSSVHEIKLIEEYTPQTDIYALKNSTNHTVTTGINGDYESSFNIDNTHAAQAEVQTLEINGTVDSTGQVEFLGTTLPIAAGSDGNAVATAINANSAAIIAAWNANNPDKEIDDSGVGISVAGNQVTITYKITEGDMPAINNTSSNGIDYTGSLETTKGLADSLTYTLDGTHSVKVTVGETIYEADGVTPADIDGLGNSIVTSDNIIQALVYQINNHKDIGGKITAYNGRYELDEDGNKILTSNPNHTKYQAPAPNHEDRYLVIEANIDGEAGKFVGELLVNEANATQNTRHFEDKNSNVSKDGIDDIHLEIYDKEISLSGGSLNTLINNIKTDSGNNLLTQYKEKLDQFARELVNLTESYIENNDQTYIYGFTDVNESYDADKAVQIDLFQGASVKTLSFNERALNTMTQEKLDYLAELQWKEDIDFDRTGQNNQSFSQFYQTLRVKVADDREGIVFKENAQAAVTDSLQTNYENIVKVDKDEELVELIKFQKAYEANAKIITVIDEMLETLLSLKR